MCQCFSWLHLPAVVPLVQGPVIHGQQREVQLRGDLPGALQRQAHPARPLQGLLQHREERQGADDPTLLQERRAQELPELQEDEGDAVSAEHPGHLQREGHHLRRRHGCVTQSNQTVKLPNTRLQNHYNLVFNFTLATTPTCRGRPGPRPGRAAVWFHSW